MRRRIIPFLILLVTACPAAWATDPFGEAGFDAKAYGGPLYEPRYCDPSGHLSMSACLLANLSLSEDYLLRAIEARYGIEAFAEKRSSIQAKARKPCETERSSAVKQYGSGEIVDFVYWSCLRREYHKAALDLIK